MFYKYCWWFILFFFIISCSSHRKVDENKLLMTSITNENFKTFYALCRKHEDTIYVYNNTEKFRNCPLIGIDCNKTIEIKSSNIVIDVNSNTLKEDRIVLYKFEENNNIYKLFFLNIQTNGTIILSFDRKYKLVNLESGVF
jgi:hypothetical protein